jgi:hypothetical protein
MIREVLGANLGSPSLDPQSFYAEQRRVQDGALLTPDASAAALLARADDYGNRDHYVQASELVALETSAAASALLPRERAALPEAWRAMRTVVAVQLPNPNAAALPEPQLVTLCTPGPLDRNAPVQVASLSPSVHTIAHRVAVLAQRVNPNEVSLADLDAVSAQNPSPLSLNDQAELRLLSSEILARYPAAGLAHAIDIPETGTRQRALFSQGPFVVTETRTREVFYATAPGEQHAALTWVDRLSYRLAVPPGATVMVFDANGQVVGRYLRPTDIPPSLLSGRSLRFELWRAGTPQAACELALPTLIEHRVRSFVARPGCQVLLDGVHARAFQAFPERTHPLFSWRDRPVLRFSTSLSPTQSVAAERNAARLNPSTPSIRAGIYRANNGATIEVSRLGTILVTFADGTRELWSGDYASTVSGDPLQYEVITGRGRLRFDSLARSH